MTTRSIPSAAKKRRAPLMSCGRSPTTAMWAMSIPSSRSRSASHGPFRSTTRPVSTSVPVTMIPARALTGGTRVGVGRAASGGPWA